MHRAIFDSYEFLQPLAKYQVPIMVIADILVHFAIVAIIGLPRQPLSILIACSMFLLWYLCTRDYIDQIYSDINGINFDTIIGTTTVAMVFIAYWRGL